MNHRYYNIPTLSMVTAPAAEPVTVQEVKDFLRIDTNYEDNLISKIITSARIMVEEYVKRSLITQSWKLAFNDFAPLNVRLMRGPVASVTSVIVTLNDGSTTSVPNTAYSMSVNNEYILFENFNAGKKVEITYNAGYGASGSSVPEPFKLAIMTLANRIYERKAEPFRIDETIRSLIDQYRMYEI